MQNYRIIGRMGEGTFSEVLKCQSHIDGKIYACKKMKQKYDNMEQVNNLREIQALRRLNPHPNIIQLEEVIFDRRSGTLALICEIMDMNIYELIKDRRSYLPEQRIRLYMYQLCKSLYHMHRNGIFHRDVKPENILIKDKLLKLADFGSCKSVYSKQPYTEYISTRWYRAPECLLTDGYYDHKMDMWSVGCVFFEVMTLRPLFPGSNELDQVSKIHDVLGSPSGSLLLKFKKHQSRHMEFNFPPKPGCGMLTLFKHGSRGSLDLIERLCSYDPDLRLTAKQALRHPYFRDLREAERRAKQVDHTPDTVHDRTGTRTVLSKNKTVPEDRRKTTLPHLQRRRQDQTLERISGVNTHDTQFRSHEQAQAQGGLLPSIHTKPYHHRYGQNLTNATNSTHHSEYPSVMPSKKSSAHGSYLPTLAYAQKGSMKQSGLFTSKHHFQGHEGKTKPSPNLPPITKYRTGAGNKKFFKEGMTSISLGDSVCLLNRTNVNCPYLGDCHFFSCIIGNYRWQKLELPDSNLEVFKTKQEKIFVTAPDTRHTYKDLQ